MELMIKAYDLFPCRLKIFTINGKNADQNDFGYACDHDSGNAEPNTCSNMQFDFKFITKEILDKYNITEEEYRIICYELKCVLREGYCNWCSTARIAIPAKRMLEIMRFIIRLRA